MDLLTVTIIQFSVEKNKDSFALTGIPVFAIKLFIKQIKLISNRKEDLNGKKNKQKRIAKRDGRIPDHFK